MLIPDKLKLNKFKLVAIPSMKDYFGRVGLMSAGDPSLYSGDELSCPEQSKIDQIAQADAEYSKYLDNDNYQK